LLAALAVVAHRLTLVPEAVAVQGVIVLPQEHQAAAQVQNLNLELYLARLIPSRLAVVAQLM